jgi:hypothetical protein
MRTTWKPHEKHGRLTAQSDLPDSVYAFPKQRKEPLTDARHVRNAVARFDQVIDASNADRALAFANIKKAARHYGVDVSERSWHELGVHPQRGRRGHAKRAAATRKRRYGKRGTAKARKAKPVRRLKTKHGTRARKRSSKRGTRSRKRSSSR